MCGMFMEKNTINVDLYTQLNYNSRARVNYY